MLVRPSLADHPSRQLALIIYINIWVLARQQIPATWQPISSTAPFDHDLELAVIDRDGVHGVPWEMIQGSNQPTRWRVLPATLDRSTGPLSNYREAQ
jgi:hypothetical protein